MSGSQSTHIVADRLPFFTVVMQPQGSFVTLHFPATGAPIGPAAGSATHLFDAQSELLLHAFPASGYATTHINRAERQTGRILPPFATQSRRVCSSTGFCGGTRVFAVSCAGAQAATLKTNAATSTRAA